MTSKLYQFHMDGQAHERAREIFPDMQVEELPAGVIVRGLIMDESHLHGVLAQLQELGLKIVSVHPLPTPREAAWEGVEGT
jgi:hypothetical protein